MTSEEISKGISQKGMLDNVADTLSGMAELSPGVKVVAKSVDFHEKSYEYDRDALPPKSAFVIGINMEF